MKVMKEFFTSRHVDCLVVVAMLSFCLAPKPLPADEPSAASLAFTSNDSKVVAARQLIEQGKYRDAETLLAEQTTAASDSDQQARLQLLDIIQRIRVEYSLSPDGLFAKVQKIIPSVTREEVDRWASESNARFRTIDGQKFYFRREPQNIFLFNREAQQCRAQAGQAAPKNDWSLVDHLTQVVAAAEKTGQAEVLPVRHHVTHTLTIHPNNPLIKKGSIVRVWLPYAQEYRWQRDVRMLETNPKAEVIAPSAIEGNPVTGGPQRTVFFTTTVTDPSQPLVFREVFEYTSYAYCPKLEESKVEPLPADWKDAYLGERLPHIVFADDIRQQVTEIVGQETNALVKARKIFRWVSQNIPWNAEDEYCTIPSLALKGFRARRGDCGVQNTVFITMCRIAGIPARWQSGFETKPGEQWGMHDWAEIYIAPYGWLPADASYGIQKSSDPRIADFYCGHQDSYRWIINCDWGRELIPPKKSLRSEPADFQRGEVEVDGINLYYNAWETKTEVDRS